MLRYIINVSDAEINRNFFGPGVGPIFLDNVSCRGSETNLANCNHNGVGNHSCSHLQDAGVICQQGNKQNCVSYSKCKCSNLKKVCCFKYVTYHATDGIDTMAIDA